MLSALLFAVEAMLPAFLAIASLLLFTPETRLFSYSAILMAAGIELMPHSVNVTALLVCTACFCGLILREHAQTHRLQKSVYKQ